MSDHPGALTRDHVVWAYRVLLDRDPENEDVIGPKLAGSRDTRELRHHLMTSAEFLSKNRDYAHTNDRTLVIKELDEADGVRLFVDLSDHVIGLNIVRGNYERDELRFVRSVLEPGDTAIDVGAHIGFFTMHMAERVGPSGRVYAFEPLDGNADLLERSIVENGFDGRVVFERAAVADAGTSASLTFPRETLNTGGAYLLQDGSPPLPGNLQQTVRVVALDGVRLQRPVRFIKIDVEGAEPRVLDGAARLLSEDRPIILSELHAPQLQRAAGMTPRTFFDKLRRLGYEPHRLENGSAGQRLDSPPDEPIASIVLVPLG